MRTEKELVDRFHDEVDDIFIDLDPFIVKGAAQGRKLARRRRLTQALAGAATVAVLGGTVAYAGYLTPRNSTEVGAAQQVGQSRRVEITPQAALKILLPLLPTAGRTADYAGGETQKADGSQHLIGASLHYTDAGGISNLDLAIVLKPSPPSCTSGPGYRCTLQTLPDGSTLLTADISASDDTGWRAAEAILFRKDGLSIGLRSDNARDDHREAVRDKPPFTISQLATIVRSPDWKRELDEEIVTSATNLFRPAPPTKSGLPQSTR
ncbi:hypothetical protein AB0P21_39370 [Kribbella sp. NPDC056861]|uniref:hypothetical protein n=1 Tax=Kribbella sp. NPDC056861 TaxID=3154857 RepID=UPI003445B05D